MASKSSTQDMLVHQIALMSAVVADLQAGSFDAMSARSRGPDLKLVILLFDSGCSRYTSSNREMFPSYKELHFPGVVRFAGVSHSKSVGIVTLAIKWPDGTTFAERTTCTRSCCDLDFILHRIGQLFSPQ